MCGYFSCYPFDFLITLICYTVHMLGKLPLTFPSESPGRNKREGLGELLTLFITGRWNWASHGSELPGGQKWTASPDVALGDVGSSPDSAGSQEKWAKSLKLAEPSPPCIFPERE